jgi:hypothetical protein
MMDGWIPPELAEAMERQRKIDALTPPEVRETINQLYQQRARIYRLLHPEPKPRTPEDDPVVPKEFLARYRTLKDNRFQVGMLVRAYLRLHERIPQAPIRESDLWGAFSAEYKAKYGHEPSRASRANFSRLLKQVGLPGRKRGRPIKRK